MSVPPETRTAPAAHAPAASAAASFHLPAVDPFAERHLGRPAAEEKAMLDLVGVRNRAQLIDETVPAGIRLGRALDLPAPLGEHEALARLKSMMDRNKVARSYLGMGYHDCHVPPVIQRNILENPGWYTAYTPYQSEISQGRLEAILNFQTLVCDLTGMAIANASMLDEGTSAAEAMNLCLAVHPNEKARTFFISSRCHPQTIEVVKARAKPKGVRVVVGDADTYDFAKPTLGVLLQYPATDGVVLDWTPFVQRAKAAGALVVVASDLLALTLLTPPGRWGADVVVGSAQRFGVPMGFGGPHAAFFATSDAHKRSMPGRLIGVSKDVHGQPAMRLALGTREQHIRRERATSNICTAQVLLSVMASMYAAWHGPEGLKRIAGRVRELAGRLRAGLEAMGCSTGSAPVFDTLRVELGEERARKVLRAAASRTINLRRLGKTALGVALDETTTPADVDALLEVFAAGGDAAAAKSAAARAQVAPLPAALARTGEILEHPVFRSYHTEHEMLRYMRRLEAKDLSLTTSMISLGSCTMKLNATAEMFPVTWPSVGRLHPFAPAAQAKGYAAMCADLEAWLCEVTGFAACSLQPNAGSQGEYAGLLVIREFHRARGEGKRDVCLIPSSAHGTNPASAVMAGMRVVVVSCDAKGNVDLADLKAKVAEHAASLSALMVTYPSTHGVFEDHIRDICKVVHDAGGQVYMDGANMNAQVAVTRPGDFGPDVCHLNLHKTFCIPHGGGGPGMGPICVAAHLAPFLPGHPVVRTGGAKAIGPVSAAPVGSASILVIPWMYIAMMGAEGLKRATEVAILNANYMAKRLEGHYPILYRGDKGRVAHEFILDCRPLKETSGIEAEDIAKRLMDYGFHAPTLSFPVAGTLMVEPTESESKAELDRFCDALIAIRKEIARVESGALDRKDNPLKNAPHTAAHVTADTWSHPYTRQEAAYPAPWTRQHKFWPSVGRVDNVYGDRNLMCACPPVDSFR